VAITLATTGIVWPSGITQQGAWDYLGRSWSLVTGSRAQRIVYQNTRTYPIEVNVVLAPETSIEVNFVDFLVGSTSPPTNIVLKSYFLALGSLSSYENIKCIVPAGYYYKVNNPAANGAGPTGYPTIISWWELV